MNAFVFKTACVFAEFSYFFKGSSIFENICKYLPPMQLSSKNLLVLNKIPF